MGSIKRFAWALVAAGAATMAMADQGLPPGWEIAFKPGEP